MFWGINLPENEIHFRKLRNIRLIIVKIRYFLSLDSWKIIPFHYHEYFLVSPQSLIIGISVMGLLFISSWLVLFLSCKMLSEVRENDEMDSSILVDNFYVNW